MTVFKTWQGRATYLAVVCALAAVAAVSTLATLDSQKKAAQSGAIQSAAVPAQVGQGEARTYVLGIKLEQAYQGGIVLRLTYSLSGAIYAWDFENAEALEEYLDYLESFGQLVYSGKSGADHIALGRAES